MMNGVCRRTAVSQTGDHRFARRHAERAAHEVEVLHADGHHQAFQPADAELHRVLQSGLDARILQTVGIAALIAELERIERHLRHGDVLVFAAVEHASSAAAAR